MAEFLITVPFDQATVTDEWDGPHVEVDLSKAEQSEVIDYVAKTYLPHEVFTDAQLLRYYRDHWSYSAV